MYIPCTVEKEAQIFALLLNLKKTASSKKPPKRRQFAQSGHPDRNCLQEEMSR
jgi:hypothetical protein